MSQCAASKAVNRNSNCNYNSKEIGYSDALESEFELMKQNFAYRNSNWNLNGPKQSELKFSLKSNEFQFGSKYIFAASYH